MSVFGEKLKKLRNLEGYTQQKFAKSAGIAIQTLRKYEQVNQKHITPDINTVKKVADFCQVTTDSLIYDESDIVFKDDLKNSISELNISHNSIENLKTYHESLDILLSSKFCVYYSEKVKLLLLVNSILHNIDEIIESLSKSNLNNIITRLKIITENYEKLCFDKDVKLMSNSISENINFLEKKINEKKILLNDYNMIHNLNLIQDNILLIKNYLEYRLYDQFTLFINNVNNEIK